MELAARGRIVACMPCTHPSEELIAVYEGTAFAKTDRKLCSLCGTLLYLTVGPQPIALNQRRDR